MRHTKYLAASAIALIFSLNSSWSSDNIWKDFGFNSEQEYKQDLKRQSSAYSNYEQKKEKEELAEILAIIQKQEDDEKKQLLQSSSSNNASSSSQNNLLKAKKQKTSSSSIDTDISDEMKKNLRGYAKAVQNSQQYLKGVLKDFSQFLKDWQKENDDSNNLIKTDRTPMCDSQFMTFQNIETREVDESLLVNQSVSYLMNDAKEVFKPENMQQIKKMTLRTFKDEFVKVAPFLINAYNAYLEALNNPCQESDKALNNIIKEMDSFASSASQNLDDFSTQFYKGTSFSGKNLINVNTSPSKPKLSKYFSENVKNAKKYLIWMEDEIKKNNPKNASESVMPYGQQAQDDKFSIATIIGDVAHIFSELEKSTLSDEKLENMIVNSFQGNGNTMLQARQAFNYIGKNHGDTSFFKIKEKSPRYYLMDALQWVHTIKSTYGNETTLDISAALRLIEQGQKCGKGLMGRTLITYKEILTFLLEKVNKQYDLSSK